MSKTGRIGDDCGVSQEVEMELKHLIVEMYKDPDVEGIDDILDVVSACVEMRVPGSESAKRFAWYMVGYYIGGMHAVECTVGALNQLGALNTWSSSDDGMFG